MKVTTRKIRSEIIKQLDKHDCWEHVIMNYISAARHGKGPIGIKFKKDGEMSRATPNGRMVLDLSKAIDDAVVTNDPKHDW